MRIRLNGQEREFNSLTTISDLLKELNIEPRSVAIEVNKVIIKKGEYDRYELKDNDSIEIVSFVGGG
ncbi:MAG: sulfur carrier protein ThiS [Thermodesulfovibrionia bacterium]